MKCEDEKKWDGVEFSRVAKDKARWRDVVEKANS
jgi:hypothetical protein